MGALRALVGVSALVFSIAAPVTALPAPPMLELPEQCTFSSTGSNPYFLLQPGWTLEFAGVEDGEELGLTIAVLDTRMVGDVETRVVFEEEIADGELVERSWNWFAHCQETGSVFYFGEHVDIYENGEIVSHEGSWEAGVDGARPGIIMPGQPSVGQVHFQEIAPIVALDMAAVQSVSDQIDVPAGSFDDAVHTVEWTPLEPTSITEKWYAPGVGLVIDGPLELVAYGA